MDKPSRNNAFGLKPRPHQQQHRSNIVECYTSRTILSTTSKQIEHVQFVSTLSKGRYFTINLFDVAVWQQSRALLRRRCWSGRGLMHTARAADDCKGDQLAVNPKTDVYSIFHCGTEPRTCPENFAKFGRVVFETDSHTDPLIAILRPSTEVGLKL